MAKVNVCYTPADEDMAHAITAHLTVRGMSVSALAAPSTAHPDGLQMSEGAGAVIVLWSARAGAGPGMRALKQTALKAWERGSLVLVRVDGASLPVGITDLPTVDLAGDAIPEPSARSVAWHTLDAQVDGRIATREAADHIPPTPSLRKTPSARATPVLPRKAVRRGSLVAGVLVLGVLLSGAIAAFYFVGAPGERVGETHQETRTPKSLSKDPQTRARERSGEDGLLDRRRERGEVVDPPPPPVERPSVWRIAVPAAVLVVSIGLLIGLRLRGHRRRAPIEHRRPEADLADGYDVFISYSRRDEGRVWQIVEALRREGLTVWIDTQQQSEEIRYGGRIVRAIRVCRSVVLMCSAQSFQSDHVVRELYVSGDYKKPFIAVQLDRTEFPDDFQYFLSGFPRVSTDDMRLPELAAAIKGLLPSTL